MDALGAHGVVLDRLARSESFFTEYYVFDEFDLRFCFEDFAFQPNLTYLEVTAFAFQFGNLGASLLSDGARMFQLGSYCEQLRRFQFP